MSDPVLLVEKSAAIATLTLNRPQAKNALSHELRTALAEAVEQLEDDPEVRVLIVTGAGDAFCAGLDLKELGGKASLLGGPERQIRTRDPARALARFSGPIIGAINGPAITGGFELALACDVLIASGRARFADTHVRVGVLPGWGLSQKLSRVIGIYRAKELSLTGNFLDAEQACAWGLVNRVVAPDLLMATCRRLAEDMCSAVPETLLAYKRMIDEGYAQSLSEALETERRISAEENARVTAADVEARREGIRQRGQAQSKR